MHITLYACIVLDILDLEEKFILLRRLFEFEFVFFDGCEKQVIYFLCKYIKYNIVYLYDFYTLL